MTEKEVIAYFGSGNKACQAIGIKIQNLTHWRKKGYIPLGAQVMFEQVTNGALKADIYDCHVKSGQLGKKIVTKRPD